MLIGSAPRYGQLTLAKSIGCGSSEGASRCLRDDVSGVAFLVDAPMFLGAVVFPVLVEVSVAPQRLLVR